MRKSLAGILLALLTTFGVVVAAAAPAGAAPSQKFRQNTPIHVEGQDGSGKAVHGLFRPDRAVRNGDGIDLVGDLKLQTANGLVKKSDQVWPLALPTPAAA